MKVNEVYISLTNGENLDNMAAWFQDNNVLFGDKNKTIYDNPSFNGTRLNKIIGDKSTNQQDLETAFCQLNKGEELVNTNDESTLSEMNTDINDNPEEIENLEIAKNIRQSTQIQIPTKLAKEII